MGRFLSVLNFFSFLLVCDQLDLALSASENSLTGNYSELSDKKRRSKEWCVSSVRVDWLISVRHSNLGDTINSDVLLN